MLSSPSLIHLHRFIPDALAAILQRAPLTAVKLKFAWRAVVGPAMDRGTTVVFDDGVLRVRAESTAWRREVEHADALIRARLELLLGRGVVRAIEVNSRSGADQNK